MIARSWPRGFPDDGDVKKLFKPHIYKPHSSSSGPVFVTEMKNMGKKYETIKFSFGMSSIIITNF